MAVRQLLFHQAARERIVRGMSVLVDAQKVTPGPPARTVLLEQPFAPRIVINSGVVARVIVLADPFENMGVQMVRQVAAGHTGGDQPARLAQLLRGQGTGVRGAAMLQNIAELGGATVIAEQAERTLDNVELAQLGSAKRVEVDDDTCTIIGGTGEKARVNARIAMIKGELAHTTSEDERETLRLRFAKLSGGVAVVKVGGSTETEMKERKVRFADALHATRAAIAEGVLPGGGVALLRARRTLGTPPIGTKSAAFASCCAHSRSRCGNSRLQRSLSG